MKYLKESLDNGLRVVLCPMNHMKSVSMGIWVGIGGRYEDDATSGVSHYLEHMLFKGTARRTAAQLTQAVEGIGGSMNAFTTEEMTCYYAKVPGGHFERGMDVLADMFRSPSFMPRDIERERSVILDELRMSIDVPSNYVFEMLREAMWPKHPLGRMLIGTEHSIKRIRRPDLVAFKKNNYTAGNIVVSVAGRIAPRSTFSYLRSKFSFVEPAPRPAFVPVKDEQSDVQLRIIPKKTEQTHFCLGVRALDRNHPDRFALRVLNAILGENMSSILFQEIREKLGLSYDISSSVERFQDTGTLLISGGVDERHLSRLLEKTLLQLKKLTRTAVPAKTLDMAKEYCVGQMLLGMEKTTSQMIYMGESELGSGGILTVEELTRKIRSVSRDDLLRVAKSLFENRRLSLAVIGPVKRRHSLRSLFHLD